MFVPVIEDIEGGQEQFVEMLPVEDFLVLELFDEPAVEDPVITLDLAAGFFPAGLGVDAVDSQFGQPLPEGHGGPVRLVVAGKMGPDFVKMPELIEVTKDSPEA